MQFTEPTFHSIVYTGVMKMMDDFTRQLMRRPSREADDLETRVFDYLNVHDRLVSLDTIVIHLRSDRFETNQAIESLRLQSRIYPVRRQGNILWRAR